MAMVAVVAHAGKGPEGGLRELREVLAREGVTDPLWYEVAKSRQAPKYARRALAQGAEVLFVWGGDGTVQRCIDAVAGTQAVLAIVPAGTANLLAENLQIPAECERFATFLIRQISAGHITNPYLEEVLTFERTCTELRFYTEEEIQRNVRRGDNLPPLVRIVTFRHDPELLLGALANTETPAAGLPEGEFHLLVDCRSGEADFRLVDAEGLNALRRLSENP